MSKKIYSNIELLSTPTSDSHIVNLKTVKNLISHKIKDYVRVVDLVGIEGTYDKDAQELTETIGTALKIDGVSLQENDRVLLASQLDASVNGVYVVKTLGTDGTPANATFALGTNTGLTNSSLVTFSKDDFLATQSASATLTYSGTDWESPVGTPITLSDYGITLDVSVTPNASDTIVITYTSPVSGTKSVLKRAEDMNKSEDIIPNMLVPVSQGSNADKLFMLVNDTAVTLDTDSINFVRYSSSDTATDKVVGNFVGDEIKTEFPIQHALNSKEIDVSFYDATGNECFFNYDLTSENVITVKPDVLLKSEDGEFKVVIVG